MSEKSELLPLRDVIKIHGLRARKSLGQNFLLDLNLTEKIARSAGNLSGVHVFEIGPGPGGLTRGLLTTDAKKITALEKDSRCIEALADVVDYADGRLEVIEADALQADLVSMSSAPRAVVANLPYNIATVLLLGWLRHIDDFQSLNLMFQKEVADRIAAKPRTKAYGRLSVMTQFVANAHVLFDLPPEAFTPPPKVMSSVVRITPKLDRERDVEFDLIERIVATAFNQRRKMLRRSLKPLCEDTETLLNDAGVKPTARAEELSVEEFVSICRSYKKLGL